jgi:hypothetical protein
MNLWVYNMIQQDTRMVKVHLSKEWHDFNKGGSTLGATIRFERFDDAHNHILAVGDVYLDSPAH